MVSVNRALSLLASVLPLATRAQLFSSVDIYDRYDQLGLDGEFSDPCLTCTMEEF